MSRDRDTTDGCGDAALYLLGLLDERHAAAFRAHASTCAVCRDEIDALRPAVDALPATVPLIAAPQRVKQNVMSVVREEAQARERPVLLEHPASERSSRRLSISRSAPALALAALLVAALAIALSAPFGGGSSRVVSAEVTMRGVSAQLHRSGGLAWLTVSGMPEPAPGHVYEVWLERSGHSMPQPTTGLFAPNSAGAGAVYVPGGLSGVSEVLVTQEPAGGTQVPTSAPVVIARVS